jgi:hypothetical protein
VSDALVTASSGTPVVVPGLLDRTGLLPTVLDEYLAGVARLAGLERADRVRRRGIEHLHEVLSPEQVAALITDLDRRVRLLTIPATRRIVHTVAPDLGNRYFVCTRMSIRALVPVQLLEPHPHLIAAPYLGGHLRPVGPHRDVDLTHPIGAVSVWAALGPARSGNTVALHSGGHVTPLTPELAPGDVLLFSADEIHASVANRTEETRVGIGIRIVPGTRLRYGPGTHWRPYADARLLDTPLAPLATARSRVTAAAFRRRRWRRRWERDQRRRHGAVPTLTER